MYVRIDDIIMYSCSSLFPAYIPLTYHILFIPSIIGGHLGSFQIWTIVNITTNISMMSFSDKMCEFLLDINRKVEWLGSRICIC